VESQNLGKFSQILIVNVHKLSTLYRFFQVLMYTIGRPPTIKAQEDEDFFCSTLYIVATAAVAGQISHNCEQLLAIHRVEYHCVNNLVRHKSSPSKGRLVRRSVFLLMDRLGQ